MVTKQRVDQMVKILGTHPTMKITRDSDRDGVINVIDCAPNNPRKHGLVKFAKERYAEYREAAKEKAVARKETRAEVRKVELEEERKQAIITAQERAKMVGERRRKRMREPGFLERLAAPPKKAPAIRRIKARKVKVKVGKPKKGKKIKYKYVTKRAKAPRKKAEKLDVFAGPKIF